MICDLASFPGLPRLWVLITCDMFLYAGSDQEMLAWEGLGTRPLRHNVYGMVPFSDGKSLGMRPDLHAD